MKKSRLALNSAAIFGASLCWLPGVSGQAVVSSGSDGSVIYTADANPNRPNGSGGQYGNFNDLIASVVITTGYENIQDASTTIPTNSVQAPAIFIQINVNPGTVAVPTDITSGTNMSSGGGTGQWYADYDLAFETIPNAGLVSTAATVSNAFGKAVGISTGENYYLNGFNKKGTSPSTIGDNALYNYSGGWSQVAGNGQSNYNATFTSITPTSITYGIPLSDLGLSVGQSFTFDAYTTYGGLPYDALDNSAFAPPGYVPYAGSTYYDSATEPGSALSTYTVAAPTLSWNNTSAAAGFGDGRTWDNNSNIVYTGNLASPNTPTNFNWNNGLYADYYVDGSNVIFNDVNNATSNGGTNANAYSVTLNTTVAPASVLVNNSLGNYTISGTGTIGGTTSLIKSGTGTLTLSTANTYSGGTNINGGVLKLGNTSALGTGPVAVTSPGILDLNGKSPTIGNLSGSGTIDNITAGGAPTLAINTTTSSNFSGVIHNNTGSVALNVSGTGTQILSGANTYSGGTAVTAGKLVIGQAGSNATFSGPTLATANTLTALPTGALSISGNGIAQLADGVTNQTFVTPPTVGANVSSNINLTSLSLTGDGTLDIGNNRILIDYSSPATDPIASIKTWIANGFADGNSVGAHPAIISSDVATDDSSSHFLYGIGYADGADHIIAGLPSGEIEIMFTLLGDANLDGTVNPEDFTPFSQNLNDSGRSWDQGDFNYDGTVNPEDFTPFSTNLNQTASLAASETGVLLSPLIGASGLSLTSVPEPASMGLLTVALVSALAHRRRKPKA